jgi:galactokinase
MENDARWRELMPDTPALAEYFSAMETGAAFASLPGDEGVGVRGGGQDHVAIMCAEAGQLSQFSYLPARLERRIDWPTDHVIAIGVSGVEATKTRNAREQYNRASDATRAIVGEWNRLTHRSDLTLANAFRSEDDAPRQLELIAETDIGPFTATYLTRRLAQFRQEIEVIVPDAGDALRHGDLTWLGSIVDRSQSLAEIALENQVPETVHLQWAARKCGAVAASAFGAGFGGAVWAMVRAGEAQDFLAVWRESYHTRFPDRAAASQWLLTRPAAAARVVSS